MVIGRNRPDPHQEDPAIRRGGGLILPSAKPSVQHAPEREIDSRIDHRRSFRDLMNPKALGLAGHYDPVPGSQFKRYCFLCLSMSELESPRSPKR
jgi:hypothetical protein